jgi:hypothetical protein
MAVTTTYISAGSLYRVLTSSITYNSITYNAGDEFVGVNGITSFTGAGTVALLMSISGASISYLNKYDTFGIKGAGISFSNPVYPISLLGASIGLGAKQPGNNNRIIFAKN